MLHHLIRPARGGAAALLVVFAVLLALAANAGLAGIPLALILLSWFFKYAYILFDHVVRGVDEPPTLDIHMVNPLNEQRPLAQLIILGVMGAAVAYASMHFPRAVAGTLAVIAALVLPASVAVLGLEGNILKAIYPVALTHLVRGLGLRYAQVLGSIVAYGVFLSLLQRLHLWLPLELGFTMFAVLSVFSMLGGALYERRHELGLETWHSPERTAEVQRKAEIGLAQDTLTEAYGLVRVGAHVKAWAILQAWLSSRGNSPEDYQWLCQAVASWSDSRYVTRLTEDFVDRLLALRRNGEALDAVAKRLRADPGFRPKSAAATLQIAQLAAGGGGAAGVARVLLSDFGERFAGDARVATASRLALHLGG